jgi:hypothetical protein
MMTQDKKLTKKSIGPKLLSHYQKVLTLEISKKQKINKSCVFAQNKHSCRRTIQPYNFSLGNVQLDNMTSTFLPGSKVIPRVAIFI